MLAIKLAFKNLIGAGLRTWLNVIVLSFAFVLIIFYNGMFDGWNRQGIKATIDWEIGQGQFWHPEYDKYDPYTIQDSHAPLSDQVKAEINKGNLTPILITQATLYPEGRVQSGILKGIDPKQNILNLPTADLINNQDEYAAIIGKRMAESTKLKVGDRVLVRWRDKNGTFDAREIQIASIFRCDVPSADNGQMYMSLPVLQKMTNMEGEATLIVTGENYSGAEIENWNFKDLNFLLSDLDKIIQSKKIGSYIMEGLLLIIALLAIFDTQVLSIFRRQKEIGTYIALGLTRSQVVGIFTVEGGAHSILAALLGAVYGIPIFIWLDTVGITFGGPDMGITVAETIYPYYSVGLIISTLILVVVSATIVSYIPSRKISKMKPTEALKGKLQ
ncbi:MAG: FtsX-like permease family protein [Bacteroidales bacterium]|nr:FtsX-like permease family protein [Bacteroidales bacterium]